MYNLLIVDDQQSSRELLHYIASESGDYHIVGSLKDADLAVDFCHHHAVDLILMDIHTAKKENGIKISQVIKAQKPNIKIIIVTYLVEQKHITEAKASGIEGFWYKDHSSEKLLHVMASVMEGHVIYPDKSPEIVVGLAKATDFTKQELKILRLIINGHNYNTICEKLHILRSTLNYHIANIKSKTGYDNMIKLAVDVVAQRFIIPEFDEV